MKLYVVTANTYNDGYGAVIELLRVADNLDDAMESVEYAKSKGWYASMEVLSLNVPTRRYLGGYIE